MSEAMTAAKRNYKIYNKELFAIVTALKKWRKQLLGAREDFKIWTDHKNLSYFRATQNINRRQARWIGDMAEYHFTIHHLEGKKNGGADGMSRCPDHDDRSNDNKNIAVLLEHLFREIHIRLLGAEELLGQPQTLMMEIEQETRREKG
jgi:hypothetical protein